MCDKLNHNNKSAYYLGNRCVFLRYVAFVFMLVGLSQKSVGMHLLYFYQIIENPCNTNCEGEHENPKATYFQHFSYFDNGNCFDVHFCRLR